MSVNVIIGPPGTGKTTALLEIVERALARGVEPRRIGFVSFARKAAREAIDRAALKFDLPARRFKYFRTLHSLAFEQLGYTRARVLGRDTWEDFAHYMHLDLTPPRTFEDETQYLTTTEDDRAVYVINLSRIRRSDLKAEALAAEVNPHLAHTVAVGLQRFKEQRGLVDFTDMIEQFAERGVSPEFDLLCIDEAQDMSRLQWVMAHKLMEQANETYIAGDDDQAIFGWAGADTETFQQIARTHPTRVLGQSYRVPVEVQTLADRVIRRARNRVAKDWRPRSAAGSVERASVWQDLPFDDGQWLILARNAYMLKHVHYYLSEYLPDAKERITVSTIHGAKGGEADNVALFTDVTRRTFEGINTDDEHRVWYVAVTRARKTLHLIEPKTNSYYEV